MESYKFYTLSNFLSTELKEQLNKLKVFFTDEQLKDLEDLGNSIVVEKRNSDGTSTYSFVRKEKSERTNDNEILKGEDVGIQGDNNFLRSESYFLEQQEKIRRIKKSIATPYRKLSDLIAATASDYNSYSSELRVLLLKLVHRFNKNNNMASSLVDAILNFAEKEVQRGVTRTVHQWYDTIMVFANLMESEDEEKLQLKSKVLSLENQVKELNEKIKEAKVLDDNRIDEIDKWHSLCEQADAEASKWQSEYEGMKEAQKKTEYEKYETMRLINENANLQDTIDLLKSQLESEREILATVKKYIGDNPLTPDVIQNLFANDEVYKKREKALEDKIKELQNKLGDKSELLAVLAEGIKDYAEEKNIDEAHALYEHLCYILKEEKGWSEKIAELKLYFKKARKEIEKRQITMTGERATYNENNNM